jgi:hypothetical protein
MTLMAESGCDSGLGSDPLAHGLGQAIGNRVGKIRHQELALGRGKEECVGELIEGWRTISGSLAHRV